MTPVRVLVIDDDHLILKLIELALQQLGNIAFRYALNGQHGAEVAYADPPDLILLDFDLPIMDGLDTLRRLRANERTARTPVVAVTATRPSTPRCAEMIEGCDAYVPKPFHVTDLRQTVRAFIGGRLGASA
jgi:DNA-binding response OmpR family regulator